jgi:hypothetical protein
MKVKLRSQDKLKRLGRCLTAEPRLGFRPAWSPTNFIATEPDIASLCATLTRMPKAFRQRGKKKKNSLAEAVAAEPRQEEQWSEEQTAGPSWIIPAPKETVNPEAPFGYVDAEVKAYFRTVDAQLRDWQENEEKGEVDEDLDPNESAFARSFLGPLSLNTTCCTRSPDVLDGRSSRNVWQRT